MKTQEIVDSIKMLMSSSPIFELFDGCSLDIHWVFDGFSLDVHWMFIRRWMEFRWVFVACRVMILGFALEVR